MHTTRARAFLGGALAFALAASLQASTPRFFSTNTQADFLRGDVENLAIDAHGRLTLAPSTELVYETTSPFVWTVLPMPDGSMFLGTGNDGKVYRVDAAGKGALFYDAGALEVHALAPAPNGGLYVATSPDGQITRVDASGKGTAFFTPEAKYIWALAVDSRGTLYAATGDKGVVYRVTPDGKGSAFYTAKATHVTSLVIERAGTLLIGTGSPGRVIRVDAEGHGFVVLDTPYQEIRALRLDDKGQVYVAAQSGRPITATAAEVSSSSAAPGDPGRAPVASVSTEITAVAVVDAGTVTPVAPATPAARGSKGAIYRIAPDGGWDMLWDTKDDVPYDLAFDAQGRAVVATGGKGKIYRLEGDPLRPTLLARATAQQVTSIYRDGKGRLAYATANPGKVYRLGATHAASGTYESDTRDALMVSAWGTISWRGTVPAGARVELFTRSGNNDSPDDTWSPWSAALTAASGTPVPSPKARYLQWKAVLSAAPGAGGAVPELTSVSVGYLQRNARPQVRSITVQPPGIVFQKPYTTGEPDISGFDDQTTPDRKLSNAAMLAGTGTALGRRTYVHGLQTFQWKADDENDDELVYALQYRREGDTAWKTLRSGLTESLLVWDTNTVPSGTYYVKLIASDAPSNAQSLALNGDLDSAAFDIDNTPPVLTVASVRADGPRTVATFDVKDDTSNIQRVEYSLDGVHWTAIFPTDGMADSKTERYELVLDKPVDARGFSVRASDALNNVVTTHIDAPRR